MEKHYFNIKDCATCSKWNGPREMCKGIFNHDYVSVPNRNTMGICGHTGKNENASRCGFCGYYDRVKF